MTDFFDENNKIKRFNKVLNVVKEHRVETIKNLAAQFKVSEMTIRRYISIMIEKKIIKLVNGAAIYIGNTYDDSQYEINDEDEHLKNEKNKIGRRAAELIEPEDLIAVDTGTTTEKLIPFIPEDSGISVLCYNLNNLLKVTKKKGCRVIIAGGVFHEKTLMFESKEGISFIKNYRINKAFISTAGINERLGITCMNNYEVEVKKAVIKSSEMKILLADSSKFGKTRPAFFAKISDFDVIITDSGIEESFANSIRNLGVKIIIV
jgi:DeoR family transcriptional regulator, deoxyribose operon repressor